MQVAIDSCKRTYAVDPNEDIKRIRNQKCMQRDKDFPEFIKYVREAPYTKNGKERPYADVKKDRNKIKERIDETLVCPMNWLEYSLDKIQGVGRSGQIATKEFYVYVPGQANNRQMSKIRSLVEEYDKYCTKASLLMRNSRNSEEIIMQFNKKTEELLNKLKGIKIAKCTMNRLIGSVLNLNIYDKYGKLRNNSKYTRKLLNMMYHTNKELFLSNFVKEPDA